MSFRIALDYRAWRVTSIVELEERVTVRMRPDLDPQGEEWEASASSRQSWDILPDHYSICARCNELQPCREQNAEYVAGVEAIDCTATGAVIGGTGRYLTAATLATRYRVHARPTEDYGRVGKHA